MNDEQRAFVRGLPLRVLTSYIADSVSDDIGMRQTTFFLVLHQQMRTADPLEFWEFCVAILREQVVMKLKST